MYDKVFVCDVCGEENCPGCDEETYPGGISLGLDIEILIYQAQ